MPKILKPSDFAAAARSVSDWKTILYDAAGVRQAKLVGLKAEATASDGDRSVDFTISTGSIDRYNSTIAVKGWEIDNFKKNSVVLWAHDDSIPAIARGEDTRVESGKLRDRAVFADRDTHPLADTVYRLIKAKFIGAASVGWIPIEWKFVEEEGRGFGIDYLRQELLEWSVVNIPANPECLVGARSMGIDTKPLRLWAERVLDQGGLAAIPRADLEALRKAAGAPKLFAARQPDDPPVPTSPDDPAGLRSSIRAAVTLSVFGSVTIDEAVDVIVKAIDKQQVREGKVVSKKNADKLRKVCDHLMEAHGHCTAILEENDDAAAAPDEDPEHPTDPDDDGDEKRQAQRVAELKGRRSVAA